MGPAISDLKGSSVILCPVKMSSLLIDLSFFVKTSFTSPVTLCNDWFWKVKNVRTWKSDRVIARIVQNLFEWLYYARLIHHGSFKSTRVIL